MLHSEVNLPIDFLVNQTLTLGTEWNSATDEGLEFQYPGADRGEHRRRY